MASPTIIEIANLQTWSLYSHYHKDRAAYVQVGKICVIGLRAALAKLKAASPTIMTNGNISENDVEQLLLAWLQGDVTFNKYLLNKPHMPAGSRQILTAILAKYIAWDAYVDITS